VIGDEQFNLPEIVAEVRTNFARYEAALLQHDIAVLNEYFVPRADTARFGIAEHSYGAADIARWRRHAAPMAAGRKLLKVVIVTFGRDAASVCAEFETPGFPLRGRQSQTWIRMAGGWKIAAAHVSQIDVEHLRTE
jgi:hypothetical protein